MLFIFGLLAFSKRSFFKPFYILYIYCVFLIRGNYPITIHMYVFFYFFLKHLYIWKTVQFPSILSRLDKAITYQYLLNIPIFLQFDWSSILYIYNVCMFNTYNTYHLLNVCHCWAPRVPEIAGSKALGAHCHTMTYFIYPIFQCYQYIILLDPTRI